MNKLPAKSLEYLPFSVFVRSHLCSPRLTLFDQQFGSHNSVWFQEIINKYYVFNKKNVENLHFEILHVCTSVDMA